MRVADIRRAARLAFGKHKGRTLVEVLADDPRYLRWLADNTAVQVPRALLAQADEAIAEEDASMDWLDPTPWD